MEPPKSVTDWVNKNYPKPRVDLEWLNSCYEWVTTERNLSPLKDFQVLCDEIADQLLQSNLQDSMSHGTGLPLNIGQPDTNITLNGLPTLVEIIAMTEISQSAFQLNQIRQSREERMAEGIGNVEGEEDGDVEIAGEGPMPKYPRGMLRFVLSDGQTTLTAMEYRKLEPLTLGITPLGYKMQLKNVRIQRGIAFLEPETVILRGGRTEEREENQARDFERDLRDRLTRAADMIANPGAPMPRAAQRAPPRQTPAPQSATAAPPPRRAPLGDINPPASSVSRDDDENVERRRRITNNITSVPTVERSNSSMLPPSVVPTSSTSAPDSFQTPSRSTFSVPRETTSSYFTRNASTSSSINRTNASSSTTKLTGSLTQNLQLPPTTRSTVYSDANDFDFDRFDDLQTETPDIKQKGKEVEFYKTSDNKRGKEKGPPIDIDPPSSDYGMDEDLDEEALNELDQIEERVSSQNPTVRPSTRPEMFPSGASLVSPQTASNVRAMTGGVASRPPSSRVVAVEVIEVNDDDDDDDDDEMLEPEDKENIPVPRRNVRMRVDEDLTFESSSITQSRQGLMASQSRRPGRPTPRRPIKFASNPIDVIDISDSD